jgi:hypothetical protein
MNVAQVQSATLSGQVYLRPTTGVTGSSTPEKMFHPSSFIAKILYLGYLYVQPWETSSPFLDMPSFPATYSATMMRSSRWLLNQRTCCDGEYSQLLRRPGKYHTLQRVEVSNSWHLLHLILRELSTDSTLFVIPRRALRLKATKTNCRKAAIFLRRDSLVFEYRSHLRCWLLLHNMLDSARNGGELEWKTRHMAFRYGELQTDYEIS